MTGDTLSVHVVPRKVYYAVFAALLVLTLITVNVAYLDLGVLNTVAALGIACAKATLVILFFMHARWSDRLIWVVLATSLLWLVILIGVTLSDYMSRGWLQVPGK